MYPDHAVDDEFQSCESDAVVGQGRKCKGAVRIAHIHHDLDGGRRHRIQLDLLFLDAEHALIDIAGVALGARDRHVLAILDGVGCLAAAHHRRNAQFARDDGRVAGAAAAVGHDRGRALHDRLPIRIGHVGDQHVAGLHALHFIGTAYDARAAGADALADAASLGQHARARFEREALDAAAAAALHGLRPGLQDIDLAGGAILAPLDIHRAAVVLLDRQRLACQLLNLGVGERKAAAVLRGHIDRYARAPSIFPAHTPS